jgi:hypothetical protein
MRAKKLVVIPLMLGRKLLGPKVFARIKLLRVCYAFVSRLFLNSPCGRFVLPESLLVCAGLTLDWQPRAPLKNYHIRIKVQEF